MVDSSSVPRTSQGPSFETEPTHNSFISIFLGTMQLLLAIGLLIILVIALKEDYSAINKDGYTFTMQMLRTSIWSVIFFSVSGCMAIAAGKTKMTGLIFATLTFCVLCAVTACPFLIIVGSLLIHVAQDEGIGNSEFQTNEELEELLQRLFNWGSWFLALGGIQFIVAVILASNQCIGKFCCTSNSVGDRETLLLSGPVVEIGDDGPLSTIAPTEYPPPYQIISTGCSYDLGKADL